MEVKASGISDVGKVRPINQDRYLIKDNLFCVADGMGGHVGGEVAAQMAVDVIKEKFFSHEGEVSLSFLIKEANLEIWNSGLDNLDLRGMGTTIAACVIREKNEVGFAEIASVGDSRVYLFRGSMLKQVTRDHTLVEELIRRGRLSRKKAAIDKRRHTLTRALGIEPEVVVDTFDVELFPGDKILLCSDGLSNELSEKEIAMVLEESSNPDNIAKKLVAMARAVGGHDNITAIVICVGGALPEKEEKVIQPEVAEISESKSPDGSKGQAKKVSLLELDDERVATESELNMMLRDLSGPPVLSFKTIGFVAVFLGIVLAGILASNLYSESSFFVGIYNDKVAIYSGVPGGVAWFSPKIVKVSNVSVKSLLPSEVNLLRSGVAESNLQDAQNLVNVLSNQHFIGAANTARILPGLRGGF